MEEAKLKEVEIKMGIGKETVETIYKIFMIVKRYGIMDGNIIPTKSHYILSDIILYTPR